MNRELIVGFLTDRPDQHQQFDRKTLHSLCSNLNRDLPILITKVQGARRTVDVGLSVTAEEVIIPYEPYRRAGFLLFRPEGATESERIKKSLTEAFEKGYESVIVLSHSMPNLPTGYIEDALSGLRDAGGIVLGPLINGGFYLIGITRSVFDSAASSTVLPELCFSDGGNKNEVIRRIEELLIPLFLLPEWYLVKTAEDLKRVCDENEDDTEWNARWTQHSSDELF
ncbi:MAG TPA: DUF2064 domain-containing protein [Spirochaetota bacterium]|nr:DUF2064 domain-containing protein [Spirochaetota bacterium]